jgi:hypothetical protein
MIITETFTSRNIRIIIVEAVFTRFSIDRKVITTIINPVVAIIDTWGVENRRFTLLKKPGRRSSRLMAIGERDALRIPELAVVIKASIAPAARISTPVLPMATLAPSEMGVNESRRAAASTMPVVTKVTNR